MAAPELNRMGAKISIKKNKAIIIGQKKLKFCRLYFIRFKNYIFNYSWSNCSKWFIKISRIYHGLRGYYNLELKLKKIGIKIISKN